MYSMHGISSQTAEQVSAYCFHSGLNEKRKGVIVSVKQWFVDLYNLPTNVRMVKEAMADVSQMLNDVAMGINELNTPVAELLAENARLRESTAAFSGEDAGESQAAENVRTAFENLRSNFSAPDVPDVEPLPE